MTKIYYSIGSGALRHIMPVVYSLPLDPLDAEFIAQEAAEDFYSKNGGFAEKLVLKLYAGPSGPAMFEFRVSMELEPSFTIIPIGV